MRGEPLVLCARHPEAGPVWYRAGRACPVCAALARLEALQAERAKEKETA